MTTRTSSGKLNRWIEQAEDLGLVVEIEDTSGYGCDQWAVKIERKRVEPQNALDQYNNSRTLWITATRIAGRAAAFKMNARYSSLGGHDAVRPGLIIHRIHGMAD